MPLLRGSRRTSHRPRELPVDAVGEQAVIDLLGVLAYAELTAFDRLAEDARLAPGLTGRAAPGRLAGAESGHPGRAARAPRPPGGRRPPRAGRRGPAGRGPRWATTCGGPIGSASSGWTRRKPWR